MLWILVQALILAIVATVISGYVMLDRRYYQEAEITVEKKAHPYRIYLVFADGVEYKLENMGIFSGENPSGRELLEMIQEGDVLRVLYQPRKNIFGQEYRHVCGVKRGTETLFSFEEYVETTKNGVFLPIILLSVVEIVFLLCFWFFYRVWIWKPRKHRKGTPVAASRKKQKNRKKQAQSKRQEEPKPPSGEESE
jgi:hypothetical protein